MTRTKERLSSAILAVTNAGGARFNIIVNGGNRWSPEIINRAGAADCTPIDHLRSRWSAYVRKLCGLGVDNETIHEGHNGSFSSTHARYVLRSLAILFKAEEEQA